MVSKEELTGLGEIVERAFVDHFGEHAVEITLDPWVDHYGYDIVDVVFVFDEMPSGLRGRKSREFRGQIDDEMVDLNLLIDTLFRFHLWEELEEAMREELP
ncbi:MAG: hypothetical protein OXU69_04675 [Gemmatimonadota bacterium]|nr:hypothetical protein [Gemmatimonadota bacterium]MDE2983981.1 hypothetical protein [Gemmatimonadota bacterium]